MTERHKRWIVKDGVWRDAGIADQVGVEGYEVAQEHNLDEVAHRVPNIPPGRARAIREEFPER